MHKPLAGQNVAILVANGFNEIEMTTFQRAVLESGGSPKVISTESSLAHGWQGESWGHYHPVDKNLADALAADYDMLIVPGGFRGHDKLKQTAHTRRFIGGFMMGYKPVLVVGDSVKLFAEIGILNGIMVTGAESVKPYVTAAGGVWSENSPTIHNNLMSVQFADDNKEETVAAFFQFVHNMQVDDEGEQQAA